jgi:hypothetical protein
VKTKAPKLTVAEMGILLALAEEKGLAAGLAAIPTPMNVVAGDLAGNPISGARVYHVPEGACGFAWVVIKPGTSRFARYLKKLGKAHKHYYGGVAVWIRAHGQSYDRKIAHARAMAKVLRKAGIDAYADGRLD